MHDAVTESIEHLRPWMPWIADEPVTVEQRRALPYMHPGRADVIGAGGLILDRILRRTTVNSMLVSEHDILDGIAWSLASPITPA